MTQIALPLSAELPRTDYLVTDANAAAAALLGRWDHWPYRSAVLFGAEAAGKSSMGEVFRRESGGLFIDDAHRADDAGIFHLWNQAQQESWPILIAFPEDYRLDALTLPDLKSRLAASQRIAIGAPDRAMIMALFEKLGRMHGLDVTPKLAAYAADRCERSYQAVRDLVLALDRITLEQRKPVGMGLLRTLLDDGEEADNDSNEDAGAA
ncbi:MAG: chromosomal replication initiator DnaA [Pseudomonadota bacterium]